MRIGFDASILRPDTLRTGGGRYAQGLLRGLIDNMREGDEIIAFGPPAAMRALPDHRGISAHEIRPLRLGKLSTIATYALRLPRAVRAQGIDLFHAPFVHTRPSLPPVPAGLGCPLVVTVHDVIPLTFYTGDRAMPRQMAWFYRWNLKRALEADRIVTVSNAAKQDIIARTGTNPGKIQVVYNGVDLPEPGAAQVAGFGQPFVLFVGSVEPRKNLLRLIEAFDRAAAGGIPHDLVLVAEGGQRHAALVYDAVERMSHSARVHVLHDVDDAQLVALYAAADMFVFPSLAEGFGLPPVEAMASGTPVVASDIPALVEVLADGAHYVDALDIASLAEGIRQCATDVALRARLTARGREIAARYTWSAAARATLDLYRHVAAMAGPEAA